MDIKRRLKELFLTKSEKCPAEKPRSIFVENPQQPAKTQGFTVAPTFTAPPTPTPSPAMNPPSFTVAKPRRPAAKIRILRVVAKVFILLNVGIGVFFYSNNWGFNAALWGYLALTTIILTHYLSVSR